ncbi:MAG: ATP-binding protein, partial [Defluviitaleaceae bacterium]|nr:ATP-binding protein [Defluviitaleaceae bacterium]
MRIIPKNTRVAIEFFKGIDLVDVLVGMLGVTIEVFIFMSNFSGKLWLMLAVLLVFVFVMMRMDADKMYVLAFNFLKFLSYRRNFKKYSAEEREIEAQRKTKTKNSKIKLPKKPKEFDIFDIMPFTGINNGLIEYGGQYFAAVLEIPSIDFKFFSEYRQSSIIEKALGGILRTVPQDMSASIIKIDRYINMDKYIVGEEKKMHAIRDAYLNGLISEEELTTRMQILLDRREDLLHLNFEDRISRSYHYLVLFDKKAEMVRRRAVNAFETLYQNDMQSYILNDLELAIFLKYNYSLDFDEHEAYDMNPADYMDWIAPQTMRFTPRKVFIYDVMTHNLRVYDYPTEVTNAWGCNIFNMHDTKIVMKLKPLDRYKAVQRIDRAIDELTGQSRATGRLSKIMEVDKHIATLVELMRMLQGDNETLFETNIYLTLYDRDYEPGTFKQNVRRALSEENFKTEDMLLKQFEAYTGAGVSAYDPCIRGSRGIHSSTAAAVFPFVLSALDDEDGINIGSSDGIPAFINFFKRDDRRVNSNMVIIGKSGGGKSYATKMILASLSAEDSKVFVLDPENEYAGIAKKMNGKLIDAGSAKQGRINPFHIVPSVDEEGEDGATGSFTAHLQFLEEFFRQILPEINPEALEQLNNMLVMLYETRGIDYSTDITNLRAEDFPTFDDLYDKILNDFQMAEGSYLKNNLRTLINHVSKFSTGGRNSALWNGESTISTNENFVVFNFQSLLANKNNTIANAQMFLILKWLDNEIIKNRDYNIRYNAARKVIIVIDEAHVFIDEKHPVALDFMFQLAKRIRKYNGMQIIITQNVKDFVGSEDIARKSTAIINACQYSFIFPLSPNDMHDLCKLYEKAG